MAAPDDDPVDEAVIPQSRALIPFVAEPPSLVPPPKVVGKQAASALGNASDWLRGHLPAIGWRATA